MISNFSFILYITDFLNQLYKNQSLLELYVLWPFTDQRSLPYKSIFEGMHTLYTKEQKITEAHIVKLCIEASGLHSISIEATEVARMICG